MSDKSSKKVITERQRKEANTLRWSMAASRRQCRARQPDLKPWTNAGVAYDEYRVGEE